MSGAVEYALPQGSFGVPCYEAAHIVVFKRSAIILTRRRCCSRELNEALTDPRCGDPTLRALFEDSPRDPCVKRETATSYGGLQGRDGRNPARTQALMRGAWLTGNDE